MAVEYATTQRKGKTFQVVLDDTSGTAAIVFRSVSKAQRASRKDLLSAFGTTDQATITTTILREAVSNGDVDVDDTVLSEHHDDPMLHAIADELRTAHRLPTECACGLELDGNLAAVLQQHGLRIGRSRDVVTEAERLQRQLAKLPCMQMERGPEGTLVIPATLDRLCAPAIRQFATVLQRSLLESPRRGARAVVVKYDVVVLEHDSLFAELARITDGKFSFELRDAGQDGHVEEKIAARHPKAAKEKRRMRQRDRKLQRQLHATGEDI